MEELKGPMPAGRAQMEEETAAAAHAGAADAVGGAPAEWPAPEGQWSAPENEAAGNWPWPAYPYGGYYYGGNAGWPAPPAHGQWQQAYYTQAGWGGWPQQYTAQPWPAAYGQAHAPQYHWPAGAWQGQGYGGGAQKPKKPAAHIVAGVLYLLFGGLLALFSLMFSFLAVLDREGWIMLTLLFFFAYCTLPVLAGIFCLMGKKAAKPLGILATVPMLLFLLLFLIMLATVSTGNGFGVAAIIFGSFTAVLATATVLCFVPAKAAAPAAGGNAWPAAAWPTGAGDAEAVSTAPAEQAKGAPPPAEEAPQPFEGATLSSAGVQLSSEGARISTQGAQLTAAGASLSREEENNTADTPEAADTQQEAEEG